MKDKNIVEHYVAFDYLKILLMIMVISHHSFLAYTPTGTGAIINDPNNSVIFPTITLYFDTFFMSLFFFISGLFTLKSIEKKGVKQFLSDRFIRIMVPFTIGTIIINVFGFYLSYVNIFKIPLNFNSFVSYFITFFASVPTGPLWFLWVLFLFNLVLVAIYKLKKDWIHKIKTSNSKFYTNSFKFLIIFSAIAFGIYSIFDSLGFTGFIEIIYPFSVQINRLGLYFLFFLIGSLIGIYGIEKSIISNKSNLSKFWWVLLALSFGMFYILKISLDFLYSGILTGGLFQLFLVIVRLLFIFVCIFACFGFIGLFSRTIRKSNKLGAVLAKNIMGTYVIHYSVVSLYQYLLLDININGTLKGIITTISAFITSFILALLLNKIPIMCLSVGGKYKTKQEMPIIIINILLLLFLVVQKSNFLEGIIA